MPITVDHFQVRDLFRIDPDKRQGEGHYVPDLVNLARYKLSRAVAAAVKRTFLRAQGNRADGPLWSKDSPLDSLKKYICAIPQSVLETIFESFFPLAETSLNNVHWHRIVSYSDAQRLLKRQILHEPFRRMIVDFSGNYSLTL